MNRFYADLLRVDAEILTIFQENRDTSAESQEKEQFSANFLCVSLQDLAFFCDLALKSDFLEKEAAKILTFARKYCFFSQFLHNFCIISA